MQILGSVYLAKHDVASPRHPIMERYNGNKLTALDLAAHAVASRPELHGFTLL